MITKILSILCTLSLCVEAIIEIQHFLLDISLDDFSVTWVTRCIVILLIAISAIALFLVTINVRVRYIPRKLWLIVIWLIAGIVWYQISTEMTASSSDTSIHSIEEKATAP